MRFGANYFLSNTAVAGGNNSSQCCKFRQDIMWSRGAKPQHAGFGKQAFGDYTWYEDRGSLDERYGYRAGPHKINVPGIEAYSTYSLDQDEYSMSDKPTVNSSFTGSWYFRQYFLDTCFTPPKKLDIRMMFEINWTNNTHRFIYNAEQDSLDTLPSVDD
jgi:hypothetical protein